MPAKPVVLLRKHATVGMHINVLKILTYGTLY